MMESDADRLDSIKALGGILVRVEGRDVWVLFDNNSVDAQPGEMIVQSTGPRFTCRTIDVKDVLTRALVEIGEVSYTVDSNEPDGTGMSLVILEAA